LATENLLKRKCTRSLTTSDLVGYVMPEKARGGSRTEKRVTSPNKEYRQMSAQYYNGLESQLKEGEVLSKDKFSRSRKEILKKPAVTSALIKV